MDKLIKLLQIVFLTVLIGCGFSFARAYWISGTEFKIAADRIAKAVEDYEPPKEDSK